MNLFSHKYTAAEVAELTRQDRARIAELSERNLETSKLNLELSRANIELTREVIRLSQRATPVISDDEIEDPPTTRDADLREARRGERSQMPERTRAPRPAAE